MSFKGVDRRRYLALVGSALSVGVAGCSGDSEEAAGGDTPVENPGDDTDPSTSADTEANTETETPTEAETSTPEPSEADIVIQSREVRTEETSYGTTDAYAVFEIVNEGDAPSGPIDAELRFYDDSDTILDTRPAMARTLGPGETWRGFKQYLGSDGEEVAAVRLEAEFDASLSVLEDVAVVESSFSAEDDTGYVTSTGVLENNTGDELDYIAAVSKFYIGEGVIAGAEYTNELNIPEGERWRFENSLNARFAPEVTNVEVIPGDNEM